MSATIIRETRETTLPAEVCEAAGLSPGDQVDWRIEDREIRGRKVVPKSCEFLDFDDLDPETLAPKIGMITEESIVRAIREDREQSR
ncbi:MAG: AbrB/MazE/SpoVT family DNA-binding domain-containing protein [Verrucomicrobiota bacterium]|jgi:bifunctional DNA-binding transcriptional regulator/antitoxin component of YhaV-PrlF toxin-antitoxin module